MSAEAEASRPVRPEWSTEGQAGLRARRRAWPSVPIGLVPIIRVVLVGQSREAVVTAQRPVRGDRLINSSACRWTVGPDGRSVQPDHQRTPKAAVSWGGSFCFPLMAPRVNPDCDEIATLVASRRVCAPPSLGYSCLRRSSPRASRRCADLPLAPRGSQFTHNLQVAVRPRPELERVAGT